MLPGVYPTPPHPHTPHSPPPPGLYLIAAVHTTQRPHTTPPDTPHASNAQGRPFTSTPASISGRRAAACPAPPGSTSRIPARVMAAQIDPAPAPHHATTRPPLESLTHARHRAISPSIRSSRPIHPDRSATPTRHAALFVRPERALGANPLESAILSPVGTYNSLDPRWIIIWCPGLTQGARRADTTRDGAGSRPPARPVGDSSPRHAAGTPPTRRATSYGHQDGTHVWTGENRHVPHRVEPARDLQRPCEPD